MLISQSPYLFFLTYQQHKLGIPANYFFPFISIVKSIKLAYEFGEKVLLDLMIHYDVLKELICQYKYGKIKLKNTKCQICQYFQLSVIN